MQRRDEREAVGAPVGMWTNEAAVPEEVLAPAAAVHPGQGSPPQQQCQQRGICPCHMVVSPCNI